MEEDLRRLRAVMDQILPQSESTWEQFVRLLRDDAYAKGEFLVRAGQTERFIYFVCEGMVRVFLTHRAKEVSLDFAFPSTFISSYSSFLQQKPSTVYLEALANTRVLKFSREHLYGLYEQSHLAERMGRLIAEYQYTRKTNREIALLTLSAPERYQQLLEGQPQLVQQIPVKYLASYLGVEPESLSRIRRSVGREFRRATS